METDYSALSGQLVYLSNDEERTQFVAIGTDTSTNTQFRPTYRINESKAPNPVFGAFGSFPWSVIQSFFSDWPTMSDQLLVLTQQEVDQYIPTGNVDDLTNDVTITKTILKGNTNFVYGDSFLPIDVEITFKGSDLITDPAEPLELTTNDKTVIGAVNENKDKTDSINTSFKALERDLLYNAVGNYIAQNPALSSYYPSRLNTIPVITGDKIPSPDYTASNTISGFTLKEDSDVNLLEAVWTSWKNIMELNTDIYGVTATNMPELSSIALNEALSGQSVIEILNNFHTTLQQIGSGGSGLTLSGLSDFVELSGRVHTNSTNISALSTNMMLMSACCGTNAYNLSALSAEVARLSKTDTLSSLITMLSTIDTLTLIQRLSGLTQDFTTILQLSTDVYNLSGSIGIQNEEIERLKLVLQPLYDVDLYDLEFCCETNRQSISALELRMDTLSLSALSGLNDIFNAVNLSTYITRLSSIEQTVAEFEGVRDIINNVTTNTINISSNVTTLSALSSNVYSQIQELRDLIPGSTDAGELSALTNIINSITDISVFLQQLSTDERMIDLELCCEENRVNIGNFTTTLSVLSSAVNNNTITINSLSGLMSQPAGVVLTTKNQTVSGHKTFKNTLVVESSGHFHNNMTLGDMSQPKIFNICSDNGTTVINITGLPSQLNINELSPGDMYTVDINGHKVLAIK